MSLTLPLAPEDVTEIVISVTDTGTSQIVASATVAPTITSVALGVPAERPLEFFVLARTAQPGPLALGGRMPGWVGRALRRIPLGREQVVLPITAHPAGALTLMPWFVELERPVKIRLGAESGDPPFELEIAPDAPRVLALREGRYRVTVAEQDEDRAMVVAGDGIFVRRRLESIGVVEIAPRAPVLPPEAVRRVELVLTDVLGDPIEPPIPTSTAGASFRILLDAFDASGMRAMSAAEVQIAIDPVPATLLDTRRFTATALPAISPPITVRGSGRVAISARAMIGDRPFGERALHDELRVNVRAIEDEPGPPSRLELEILGSEDDLIRGARVSVELIDRRGFFAEDAVGIIDFGESDPWLFFPQGPSAEVTPADKGHLIRDVARPSGPRGLVVVLRAASTSTVIPGTLTASVTLPVLESSK